MRRFRTLMMSRAALAVLALVAGALPCAAAPRRAAPIKGPAPKIDRIEMKLLYETSGTLSSNIAPPATFSGWNTIIAEGDAKEPANDVLVLVHMSVPGDEANVELPLRVQARDGKGKALASRTFNALFFKKGRSVQALFVPNSTCAETLTVEAAIGQEKKSTAVKLDCGE